MTITGKEDAEQSGVPSPGAAAGLGLIPTGAACRLLKAVLSPRESLLFLHELHRKSEETSRRVVRDSPGARWRLRADPGERRGIFLHGLRTALLDPSAPRYRVCQLKPSVAGERPRILHVIPNVLVGGSTQLLVDLHERLGHLYDMHVLTATLPPGGAHAGMSIRRIDLDGPCSSFVTALEEVSPDAVHVHYWGSMNGPWYERAFCAASQCDIPIIQNVNTPVPPFRDARIAATVFVSEYVRDTFAPDMARAPVIYPGIDAAAFRPAKVADPDARDTVIMVYRLDRDKLGEESIDPLIIAARTRPRTRFVVVGEGPLLLPFVDKVSEAGCRESFDFRGYVPYDRLPSLYVGARVFVAPVVCESFGQVVPFAMEMGLAVAGNRVGALEEILGSRETLGESAEQTADIIVRLLEDEEEAARRGNANRIRARRFHIEGMIERYHALYAQVLHAA